MAQGHNPEFASLNVYNRVGEYYLKVLLKIQPDKLKTSYFSNTRLEVQMQANFECIS